MVNLFIIFKFVFQLLLTENLQKITGLVSYDIVGNELDGFIV